jgi:hypothetical protein
VYRLYPLSVNWLFHILQLPALTVPLQFVLSWISIYKVAITNSSLQFFDGYPVVSPPASLQSSALYRNPSMFCRVHPALSLALYPDSSIGTRFSFHRQLYNPTLHRNPLMSHEVYDLPLRQPAITNSYRDSSTHTQFGLHLQPLQQLVFYRNPSMAFPVLARAMNVESRMTGLM